MRDHDRLVPRICNGSSIQFALMREFWDSGTYRPMSMWATSPSCRAPSRLDSGCDQDCSCHSYRHYYLHCEFPCPMQSVRVPDRNGQQCLRYSVPEVSYGKLLPEYLNVTYRKHRRSLRCSLDSIYGNEIPLAERVARSRGRAHCCPVSQTV